jgi:hypothetical protein
MFEPIKFDVFIEVESEQSWADVYSEGMRLARKILEVGAKPILSGASPKATHKNGAPEPDEPPTIATLISPLDIAVGMEIVNVRLGFSQTWQIERPYRSSVSPSTSIAVDLSLPLDQAVPQAWETLIVGVYVSVQDFLVAGGRWSRKLA